MKNFSNRHLHLFLLQSVAAVAAGGVFPLHAQTTNAPETRAQITAVIQAQQEAWNRGDIDAFMNGYARGSRQSGSDSTRFAPGGQPIAAIGWVAQLLLPVFLQQTSRRF